MKKYRLLDTDTKIISGNKLYRIQACTSFGEIQENDLGGYIESEANLSHEGDAWVSGNAMVSGNARTFGDARVSGNARVSGDARTFGNARIFDDARIFGDARIFDNARIFGNARVKNNSDYLYIKGIGSCYRNTTAYMAKSGIEISCGCFCGTLKKFEDRVNETHKDTKFAKEYQLFIEIIKLHFMLEEGNK